MVLAVAVSLVIVSTVHAAPVLWTLTDVEFDDGAIGSGSFVYDADTNAYSAVSVGTAGGSLPAAVYGAVVFGGEFDAFMVSDPFADLTGQPALQLLFQAPLTNSAGFVDLASFDPFSSSFEATCFDTTCFDASIDRVVVTGGLIGTVVPLPGALILMLSALGLMIPVGLRQTPG